MINRRTPLTRHKPLERKTRLNPVSKKTAKRKRQTDPIRKGFAQRQLFCEACVFVDNRNRMGDHVHEIARGPARDSALEHEAALLHPCFEHHEAFDDYSEWPIARQLALKLLSDPHNFDRVLINDLRGRDENAIDLSDVVKWLRMA